MIGVDKAYKFHSKGDGELIEVLSKRLVRTYFRFLKVHPGSCVNELEGLNMELGDQ